MAGPGRLGARGQQGIHCAVSRPAQADGAVGSVQVALHAHAPPRTLAARRGVVCNGALS